VLLRWRGCRTMMCDPVSGGINRGLVDHGFRAGGVAFVVLGQAAVGGDLVDGPLDRPAAWNDCEAALVSRLAGDAQ